MIPTRDNDNENMTEKKTILSDEHNLVTGELIQVLNSKQARIDQLEQRLKQVEHQELQWKVIELGNRKYLVFFCYSRQNTNENIIVVNC